MSLDIAGVKERLLITVTTYDDGITVALAEAVRFIAQAVQRYNSDFLESDVEDNTVLGDAGSDLGAGIFKRRLTPGDFDIGWWAQGLKKLDTYIFATFPGADVKSNLLDAQIALLIAQTDNATRTGNQIDAQAALIASQKTKLDSENTILQPEVDSALLPLQDGEIYFCGAEDD